MSSWLRWLLGLDEGEVPAGSEYHWEFAGLPEGNLFFVTAMIIFACIAMIIVLYRSEKTIGGFQKFVLSALRLGALAIIVLILLHPRILTEIQVERRGKAVILFDQSISMAEQDSFEGDEAARLEDASDLALADEPTRTQLAVASFQKQKLIDALSEKNEVAIYGFGETVAPISSLESATDVEPVQEGTRLGDAMIEALREHGRQPLAGVVVVSDGRNNAGEAPLDASRRVVAENGAVIHAVGVGRAQLPKNYAVQDLSAPKAVEVGYPIEIQGKVVISGIPGPARVELIRQLRGTRGTTVVDERVINPGKKYFETRLKFVDVLPRKGTYRYELRFKTKNPEETRIRDNRREIFVRASDQEYRVLLVAGNAVPEFRYLRNFTIRDNSIVVSTWQSSADRRFFQDGNVPIRRVPETLKAIDDYDVIVLIDPKPTDLSEQFQTTVREFVTEGGGGLVFVSSESYTQQVAESSSFRVLQSLIPVSLFSRPNPPGQVYSDAWRPQLTTSGADHPLCRLIDDPKQNLKLWSQLPVFYYLHGAGKLRPAARALCVRGNTIVSAIQRVGL
ncbi:MAG: vWA domain-containing protein [Planctomycetota bacterium]